MTGATSRVEEAAAALGLDIELRERPAARSLPEAAELLGLRPADIVKTLVVKKPDDTFVFALVPGDDVAAVQTLVDVIARTALRTAR